MEVTTLSIQNYTQETGKRFRVTAEQNVRIKAGLITREQAFDEFIANGAVPQTNRVKYEDIPAEVYREPGLTLENFGEVTQRIMGVTRRFRVTPDQSQRIKAGTLTREQALVETINS